jgi:hypothetical protein
MYTGACLAFEVERVMKNKSASLALLFSGTMLTTLAFASQASAAEEETLGNNLSYPAKLIGGGAPALRLPCSTAKSAPSGPQSTAYDGYWLQKTEAEWQAVCETATDAVVTAVWGSNLIDGRLRAGKPIRVEMNLIDQSAPALPAGEGGGYLVENLTPDLDDRVATYGTNGTELVTNYRVFDTGAKLMIERCADDACAAATTIYDAVMSAEINSLGNIVYGYNWGTKGPSNAATVGTYRITFTPVAATLSSSNSQLCADKACTYVIVKLVKSGGGGGGAGGGRP